MKMTDTYLLIQTQTLAWKLSSELLSILTTLNSSCYISARSFPIPSTPNVLYLKYCYINKYFRNVAMTSSGSDESDFVSEANHLIKKFNSILTNQNKIIQQKQLLIQKVNPSKLFFTLSTVVNTFLNGLHLEKND